MKKQESSALNVAKFIRSQTLLLLEKLDVLDLDEEAVACEQLHEAAETLYLRLKARFTDDGIAPELPIRDSDASG